MRLEVEHSCRVGRLQVGNACDAGARAGEEGDAEIWRVLGEAPALRQGARNLSESNAASVVLELVPEGRVATRSGVNPPLPLTIARCARVPGCCCLVFSVLFGGLLGDRE